MGQRIDAIEPSNIYKAAANIHILWSRGLLD